MRIHIQDLLKAYVSPAGAKSYFLKMGWDWRDFLQNGRELSEEELDALPADIAKRLREMEQ